MKPLLSQIKWMILVAIFFGMAGSLRAWVTDNGDGTYSNPMIYADYPDCDVIRVGDDYYYVSSSFHFVPGDPLLQSKDLVNWEVVGYPVPRYDGIDPRYDLQNGGAYGKGSWAPSVRYHDGTYYVCFWIRRWDQSVQKGDFWVCRATNPAGPWTMNMVTNADLYDPGLFFDDNGKVYVFHGQYNIYCTELNASLTAVQTPGVRVFGGTGYPSNLEGSHAYKINGYYYVLNPGGGYQHAFRSTSIYGPYEHQVILNDDINYTGAGLHQGGIVETQTGEWWVILFQDRGKYVRIPSLLPVIWTNGWPMIQAVTTTAKPNVGTNYPPTQMKRSDNFGSSTLGLQWQWNHNPDDTAWTLTERPGWLRLKSATVTPFWIFARNTLTQRILAPESGTTVKLDVSGMQNGDVAGLGVYQLGGSYIAVTQTNGVRSIVVAHEYVNGATQQKDIRASIPLTATTVWFKVKMPAYDQRAQYYYSLDGVHFSPLAGPQTMEFATNAQWVGLRYGLFNFSTVSTGGYVDFDDFTYDIGDTNGNLVLLDSRAYAWRYDDKSNFDTAFCVDDVPADGIEQCAFPTTNGGWLKFNRVDFGEGIPYCEGRVASSLGGGTVELRLDVPDGELIGVLNVPITGGTNQFATVWCPVSPVTGLHALFLVCNFTAGDELDLNWVRFTFNPTYTPPPIKTRIEAENYSSMSGIQSQATTDVGGGTNIGWINNGDWCAYTNVDFGANTTSFTARVASGGSGGTIQVRDGDVNGSLLATLTVPATGGWQTWQNISTTINVTGVHTLYLSFVGGSGYLFNLNWFELDASGIPTTPSPIAYALNGNQLQITWPASHLGWHLETQTNSIGTGLGTNWVPVSGSGVTNQVFLPLNTLPGSVFYRLVYP